MIDHGSTRSRVVQVAPLFPGPAPGLARRSQDPQQLIMVRREEDYSTAASFPSHKRFEEHDLIYLRREQRSHGAPILL